MTARSLSNFEAKTTSITPKVYSQFWRRSFKFSKEKTTFTHITMQSEFWIALECIARVEDTTLQAIIETIMSVKQPKVSFAIATQTFVLSYLLGQFGDELLEMILSDILVQIELDKKKQYPPSFEVISIS